jgi:hypothetical protein
VAGRRRCKDNGGPISFEEAILANRTALDADAFFHDCIVWKTKAIGIIDEGLL